MTNANANAEARIPYKFRKSQCQTSTMLIRKNASRKKTYRPWNLLGEPSSNVSSPPASRSEDLPKQQPETVVAEQALLATVPVDNKGQEALDIAIKSPATNQQIASISPAISPATNQHIASIKSDGEKKKPDIASISPAISPADTPANRQQPTSISPAIWNVAALSGKEALLLGVILLSLQKPGIL